MLNYVGLRIKKIRLQMDATQEEFANRIGIKQNTIAVYESGNRNISETVIKAVCREFGVNEIWLRTGEGEMFNPSDTQVMDSVERILSGQNEFVKFVFRRAATLPSSVWDDIEHELRSFFSDHPDSAASDDPDILDDVRKVLQSPDMDDNEKQA